MLARALPGVAGARRRRPLPRRAASPNASSARRSTCSTMGFSISQLARDVDLLLVVEDDLDRSAAAGGPAARAARRPRAAADAVLVTAGYDAAAERVGRALGVPTVVPRHARDRRRRVRSPSRRSVVVPSAIARVRGRRHRAARAVLRRRRGRRLGRRRDDDVPRSSSVHAARRRRASPRAARARRGADRADDREGRRAAGGAAISSGAADRGRAARRRRSSRRSVPTGWLDAHGCAIRHGRTARRRMKHRLEYVLVRALDRGRPRAAGLRSCARCGAALGLPFYALDRAHRRIADAEPRGGVSRAVRGGAPRDRARRVRAFRPPAVRAAEVQHAVARRRCWRASSSKARSASRLAYAQGKGVLFFTGHFGFWELQALVHALQLAADGVLARALDNPQLNDAARADPHAHRQHGDLPRRARSGA